MTMQAESLDASDVLGLVGSFPRPGWVVLDAIRERRYTGEVVFATNPEVRVYADLGRIYLAERVSDPSLGSRLVDAGALNAAQLEHGAVRVIDDSPSVGPRSEYLGRLFERVPSVDRHIVLVTTDMMNDECVGWVAGQRISDIDVTPYRHHASGAQRWDRPFGDLAPGDPLPAPGPDAAPIEHAAPVLAADRAEPLFTPIDSFDADGVIQWTEPSWLDERPPRIDLALRLAQMSSAATVANAPAASAELAEPVVEAAGETATDVAAHAAGKAAAEPEVVFAAAEPELGRNPANEGDWIDDLDSLGLPEPGSDPLSAPVRMADLGHDSIDRFELIWPSGEIDEQFGDAVVDAPPHPDYDRAGRTARVVRDRERTSTDVDTTRIESQFEAQFETKHDTQHELLTELAVEQPADSGLEAASVAGLEAESIELLPEAVPGQQARQEWLTAEHHEAITDDVVMAVRRAVASIETGSLAARRRLAESPGGEPRIAADPMLPGRIALRVEPDFDSPSPAGMPSRPITGSVFDDPPGASAQQPINVALPAETPSADSDAPRTSALRRLIGSLRKR